MRSIYRIPLGKSYLRLRAVLLLMFPIALFSSAVLRWVRFMQFSYAEVPYVLPVLVASVLIGIGMRLAQLNRNQPMEPST